MEYLDLRLALWLGPNLGMVAGVGPPRKLGCAGPCSPEIDPPR